VVLTSLDFAGDALSYQKAVPVGSYACMMKITHVYGCFVIRVVHLVSCKGLLQNLDADHAVIQRLARPQDVQVSRAVKHVRVQERSDSIMIELHWQKQRSRVQATTRKQFCKSKQDPIRETKKRDQEDKCYWSRVTEWGTRTKTRTSQDKSQTTLETSHQEKAASKHVTCSQHDTKALSDNSAIKYKFSHCA
jgi:hypothetical protein